VVERTLRFSPYLVLESRMVSRTSQSPLKLTDPRGLDVVSPTVVFAARSRVGALSRSRVTYVGSSQHPLSPVLHRVPP